MSADRNLFDHQHVTVIRPRRGWRALDLGELWAYRELLWVLAARDVRVRYKQTVLGAGWALLRPLLLMLIFSVVFGRLAKLPSDGLPYPVFVFAGLLPWLFFATAVSASAQSLVNAQPLVSKVYFPRIIVPLSSVGAGLVDLLVATALLLLLMLWYGLTPGPGVLLTPLLMLGVAVASLGIGIGLCALCVSYRDVRHLEPFLVQIWMYLSPVIYPVTLVPEPWRWLLYFNPMTGFIEAWRAAYLGTPLDAAGLAVTLGVSVALLVAAVAYFERVERRFADVI